MLEQEKAFPCCAARPDSPRLYMVEGENGLPQTVSDLTMYAVACVGPYTHHK